ncbi:hypothetical protein IU479_28165 [Nocardia abscessus]|uniref:hypothetical protein n=1 Tax=Nocardia abscessus TaxID=120957 RepID=UPI0018946E1D|nr:hypothetical protein [Nocardia abscessus]MBF6221977.1 hypothetical protein [Nocardia abscessus]
MEDIMRERNGIAVFEVGEDHPDHPAFRELRGISLGDVRFHSAFSLSTRMDNDMFGQQQKKSAKNSSSKYSPTVRAKLFSTRTSAISTTASALLTCVPK